MHKIFLSGHRGYNDKEIENSPSAFKRAIKEKLDYVEFDVKSTKDGIPVVFHDNNLKRLLGVNKRLDEVSFKELKEYSLENGEKVLGLREFLELTNGKINYMLEIKSRRLEEKIISLLNEYRVNSRTIIQSFNPKDIKNCFLLDKNFRYGLCIGPVGNLGFLGQISGLHYLLGAFWYFFLVKPSPATYLNIDGPLVNDAFISICKRYDKKIILGANNTWRYLDKLKKWRVEIINADNPKYIKQLLESQTNDI